MKAARPAAVAALMLLALAAQVSVLPHLAWRGVVPDLCLLVVVGVALALGPRAGMVAGFGGGLLLDLAPPADHLAGRWALALVLVGYLAGLAQSRSLPALSTTAAVAATSSFVGTSVFALTGMLLGEVTLGIPELLGVVVGSVLYDVLAGLVVVPAVWRLLMHSDTVRVAAR